MRVRGEEFDDRREVECVVALVPCAQLRSNEGPSLSNRFAITATRSKLNPANEPHNRIAVCQRPKFLYSVDCNEKSTMNSDEAIRVQFGFAIYGRFPNQVNRRARMQGDVVAL